MQQLKKCRWRDKHPPSAYDQSRRWWPASKRSSQVQVKLIAYMKVVTEMLMMEVKVCPPPCLPPPFPPANLQFSQINICAICRLLSLCAHQAHCVAIHTLATKLRSRDRASELVGSACFRNEDTVDAFNLCWTANIWRIACAMSRISFLVTPFSINVMIPFRSAPQAKRRKGRKKIPFSLWCTLATLSPQTFFRLDPNSPEIFTKFWEVRFSRKIHGRIIIDVHFLSILESDLWATAAFHNGGGWWWSRPRTKTVPLSCSSTLHDAQ